MINLKLAALALAFGAAMIGIAAHAQVPGTPMQTNLNFANGTTQASDVTFNLTDADGNQLPLTSQTVCQSQACPVAAPAAVSSQPQSLAVCQYSDPAACQPSVATGGLPQLQATNMAPVGGGQCVNGSVYITNLGCTSGAEIGPGIVGTGWPNNYGITPSFPYGITSSGYYVDGQCIENSVWISSFGCTTRTRILIP